MAPCLCRLWSSSFAPTAPVPAPNTTRPHVPAIYPTPRPPTPTPLQLAANKDEAERYLEPRHLVDLFREFGALDVGTVIPRLRHLQPRLYSISSSMLESPMRVQCTIAVVRYESLGEERVGVCSTYCGERLEVRQDDSRPIGSALRHASPFL